MSAWWLVLAMALPESTTATLAPDLLVLVNGFALRGTILEHDKTRDATLFAVGPDEVRSFPRGAVLGAGPELEHAKDAATIELEPFPGVYGSRLGRATYSDIAGLMSLEWGKGWITLCRSCTLSAPAGRLKLALVTRDDYVESPVSTTLNFAEAETELVVAAGERWRVRGELHSAHAERVLGLVLGLGGGLAGGAVAATAVAAEEGSTARAAIALSGVGLFLGTFIAGTIIFVGAEDSLEVTAQRIE